MVHTKTTIFIDKQYRYKQNGISTQIISLGGGVFFMNIKIEL